MNRINKLTFLLVALVFLCSSVPFLQAQDEPNFDTRVFLPLITNHQGRNLEQRALALVAVRNNLPEEELTVAHSTTAEYTLQGKTAIHFKIADQQLGNVYGVTLAENGQELDAIQLEAEEQAATIAKYGKLDPSLAEYLAGAPERAPIEVIIWLKEPQYNRPERPTPKNESDVLTVEEYLAEKQRLDTFYAQVDANLASIVASTVAPVADRLTRSGYDIRTDKYTPVLYTHLTSEAISEVAMWDEVDQVYLSPINQQTLDIARQTIGAHIVHGSSITGNGVKVAQIEVGKNVNGVLQGVRVVTANPYLTGATVDSTYNCTADNGHATAVAGIIRAFRLSDSGIRGIAPGVSLWAGGSCNGSSTELQNRSTAAADWGASVINLSWGCTPNTSGCTLRPNDNDKFYDRMVRERARTIVVAAGNEAGPCASRTGNVTSPGLAYNVITVGNFDDKNTPGWSNPLDSINECSSWRDPISSYNDREKPEVAAPGTSIYTTLPRTSAPLTGVAGSGTSFAAPMVTGVAALLIQRSPVLAGWPETIKAIMMATAVHNIEGLQNLSEKDGAGGIAAHFADTLAFGGWGNTFGGRGYSCSTANPLDVATMPLTALTRTRVVIAWDNDPNYGSYASQPSMDLDLLVISPSGTAVASSTSYDNTYEIVDFTPSVTGNYKLRVSQFRCSYGSTWLGWAWLKGNF